MSKVVYKYGTGQPIPDNSVYLCTQVETEAISYQVEGDRYGPAGIKVETTNKYVWHYYELPLVPVAEEFK